MANNSIFTGIYLSSKGLGTLDRFQLMAPDYIPVGRELRKIKIKMQGGVAVELSPHSISLILRKQGNVPF